MATLKNTTVSDTGAIQLPVGTTAQRPGSPSAGQMRYNSTFKTVETYDGSRWRYMPDIVRNGLVQYLDAGEPSSYPGSGTTWSDLSGNGNNTTLTNGPTYSGSNGGSFVFDGVDDYATTGSTFSVANNLFADANGSWTVSAWFKFPVSPTQARDDNVNSGNCSYSIVGRSGGIATGATFTLFVAGASTAFGSFQNKCVVGLRGANTQISSTSVNTNTWFNATVTWNASTALGYLNGINQTLLGVGSASVQTRYLNIGTTAEENAPPGNIHFFEGSIGNVFIYNRALTPQEIKQNYEALRGRFGI